MSKCQTWTYIICRGNTIRITLFSSILAFENCFILFMPYLCFNDELCFFNMFMNVVLAPIPHCLSPGKKQFIGAHGTRRVQRGTCWGVPNANCRRNDNVPCCHFEILINCTRHYFIAKHLHVCLVHSIHIKCLLNEQMLVCGSNWEKKVNWKL